MTTHPVNDSREHKYEVTPLELFFDLVFVFAITQVTRLFVDDPTWGGVLRGVLVLAALWWAWDVFAWLTSALDVDEGGTRLVMLASMGASFGVALAVRGAFGVDAVLFACAYLVLRLLHLALSAVAARNDRDRRSAFIRFVPTSTLGPLLLLVAAFLEGNGRIVLWIVALAIDYLGPAVIGMGRGWRVSAEHFAERHGLIIIIALGESLIAIAVGFAEGVELVAGLVVGAALGLVAVSALWWLYFDVAAIFVRKRLREASGIERARLARDSYSYLHLPMVAGVVFFAFGLETTLHHFGAPLAIVPAVALCGGAALYLLSHIAFLFRATRYLFRLRTIGAIVLLAFIPAAIMIPALATLAVVSTVCSLVVAYETIHHRAARIQIRNTERAGR